jgi:hypothetical protein
MEMLNDLGWIGARFEGKEELVAPVAISTGTDDGLLVLNADGYVLEAAVTICTLEPSRNFLAALGGGIVLEIGRNPTDEGNFSTGGFGVGCGNALRAESTIEGGVGCADGGGDLSEGNPCDRTNSTNHEIEKGRMMFHVIKTGTLLFFYRLECLSLCMHCQNLDRSQAVHKNAIAHRL